MKMKVFELTGRALDYAVAVALGAEGLQFDTIATWWIKIDGRNRALSDRWSSAQSFCPSTGPAGDDIIDREKISASYSDLTHEWLATAYTENQPHDVYGATRREAAMRAFVASRLGEEIDIPKEML